MNTLKDVSTPDDGVVYEVNTSRGNTTIGEIVTFVTNRASKKLLKRLGKYALAWMIFEAVVGGAVGRYFGVMYSEQALSYVGMQR